MSRWSQPATKNLAAQLRQSEKPAERSLDCKCPTLTSQIRTIQSVADGQIRVKISRLQNDLGVRLAYEYIDADLPSFRDYANRRSGRFHLAWCCCNEEISRRTEILIVRYALKTVQAD